MNVERIEFIPNYGIVVTYRRGVYMYWRHWNFTDWLEGIHEF